MSSTALHYRKSLFAPANRRRSLRKYALWDLLRVWVRRARGRSELRRYMEMHFGIGEDTGIFIADAQRELSRRFWQP